MQTRSTQNITTVKVSSFALEKNGILVATMVLFSQESGYGRIKVANSANLAIIQGCARGFARRGFSLVKAHFDKRSLFVQSLESSTWDAMCS